jgi:hypothetical protein
VNKDLIDSAFRAAMRMADDRGIDLNRDALMGAPQAVAGESNGQDEPDEIAEDAIELLGKSLGTPSSRRERRPF